jgi:hypothetical protein
VKDLRTCFENIKDPVINEKVKNATVFNMLRLLWEKEFEVNNFYLYNFYLGVLKDNIIK